MFVGGRQPALLSANLKPQSRQLCYTAFAILHSGLTKGPLWSAEHLTAEHIQAARELVREDSFHPDESIPRDERAELSDYRNSGYDRGHMSPNGDMYSTESQSESFNLSNMIPQNPDNNRHLWADIESSVRNLAIRDGEVFVVTGPIFIGDTVQALKSRVLIPTNLFKAVYDPARGQAAAYLTPNAEGHEWQTISITQLTQMTGIDVFPALPQSVKASAMQLPAPSHGHSFSAGETPRRHASNSEFPSEAPTTSATSNENAAGGFTCADGSTSHAQHRRGACSHHGGVSQN